MKSVRGFSHTGLILRPRAASQRELVFTRLPGNRAVGIARFLLIAPSHVAMMFTTSPFFGANGFNFEARSLSEVAPLVEPSSVIADRLVRFF